MAMVGFSAMAGTPALADGPQRVVSINLCTDQLAMLLAAPGQLLSVSFLALDPTSSAMVEEAAAFAINHSQAEEIAFLRPDLVLAGRYSNALTLQMLERLGYELLLFDPETSIADIRTNLRKMGKALGQEPRAEALIALMDRDLAALAAGLPDDRPRAALYYSAGYTLGAGSLADDILTHAGLQNIAPSLGLSGGGTLPLEALVLAGPDVIVRGQSYEGYSRDEDLLRHPVLQHFLRPPRVALQTTPEWTCGTPQTIAVIEQLAKAARHRPE